jgi:hypothetical protein
VNRAQGMAPGRMHRQNPFRSLHSPLYRVSIHGAAVTLNLCFSVTLP